jgi:peroxiredoxin
VINAYDGKLELKPGVTVSNRTSYVINTDGKIVYAYTDRDPDKHVENTLAAVKALKK